MAAPLRRHDLAPAPRPALICLLRHAALTCRIAPRDAAAGSPTLDPGGEAADAAIRTMRILPQIPTRRPVFWRPGTAGRSFDDDRLLSLVRAIDRGDATRADFLMRRRVPVRGPQVAASLAEGAGGAGGFVLE